MAEDHSRPEGDRAEPVRAAGYGRHVSRLAAGLGLAGLAAIGATAGLTPERAGRAGPPPAAIAAQGQPEARADIAQTGTAQAQTAQADITRADTARSDTAPPTDLADAASVDAPDATTTRWKNALIEPRAEIGAAEAPAQTAPETAPAPEMRIVPVPRPRPAELGASAIRRPVRAPRRTLAAAPPAPVEDTRSFFDKLFGIERPTPAPAPALAYAALETTGSTRTVGPGAVLPRAVPAPSAPAALAPVPRAPVSGAGGTAVYDITARTVTLPSGERLEAHSGLGAHMDDPRSVHVRMRGPTPPGSYDLTEREDLFHGVRALRLTPAGGSAAIHGRDGILAHTYMLGPSGASNGCVVFREYDRFLQAYLRGEIARLVVVTGAPQDALPSLASNLTKALFGAQRPTRAASAE